MCGCSDLAIPRVRCARLGVARVSLLTFVPFGTDDGSLESDSPFGTRLGAGCGIALKGHRLSSALITVASSLGVW